MMAGMGEFPDPFRDEVLALGVEGVRQRGPAGRRPGEDVVDLEPLPQAGVGVELPLDRGRVDVRGGEQEAAGAGVAADLIGEERVLGERVAGVRPGKEESARGQSVTHPLANHLVVGRAGGRGDARGQHRGSRAADERGVEQVRVGVERPRRDEVPQLAGEQFRRAGSGRSGCVKVHDHRPGSDMTKPEAGREALLIGLES
jgi:hypothetical protein